MLIQTNDKNPGKNIADHLRKQGSIFDESRQKEGFLNKTIPLSNTGLLRKNKFLQEKGGSEPRLCLQTKQKSDQPVDQYEQEADRIADLVVRLADSGTPCVRPACPRCIPVLRIEPHEAFRRKKTPEVDADLNRRKGSGLPLPDHARTSFEARFGYDFSEVKIHSDGQAAKLAQRLDARAFTTGHDIYFGVGLYQPETDAGQRLLAHELTHVIQQSGSTSILQKDLDERALQGRAQQIFDALQRIWGPDIRAIICDALQGLTQQDAQALINAYNATYSASRGGRTLPEDLVYALHDPIHRYRALNLLHHQLIHPPGSPSLGAHRPHIAADPEIREIVPGTRVTYTMEAPEILGGSYQYQWLRRNDPSTLEQNNPPFLQGPTTPCWEVTWEFPGRHTLICELSVGREIEGYYEYIQVVRMPEELASEAIEQAPRAVRPDLYISRMRSLLANLRRGNRRVDAERIRSLEQAIERARILEVPPALETRTMPGETAVQVVPGRGGPGPFLPMRAILIPTAHPEPVLLSLFTKPLGDDRWEILDLTDPSGSVEPYIGSPDPSMVQRRAPVRAIDRSAVEAAWRSFVDGNHHPAGQLLAEPPTALGFPPGTRWSARISRITNLSEVSLWLSRVGLVTGLAGMAMSVVPGGQPVAVALLLIASSAAGAAATTLEMLERYEYGQLRWDVETALDLLDLAGCLAIGVGTATRLSGRALTATSMRAAFLVSEIGEGVDTGSDLASGFVLSVLHYQRIQQIRERYRNILEQPGLTREQIGRINTQMRIEINDELRDAIAQNGLILLGVLGTGGPRRRQPVRPQNWEELSIPDLERWQQILSDQRRDLEGAYHGNILRIPDELWQPLRNDMGAIEDALRQAREAQLRELWRSGPRPPYMPGLSPAETRLISEQNITVADASSLRTSIQDRNPILREMDGIADMDPNQPQALAQRLERLFEYFRTDYGITLERGRGNYNVSLVERRITTPTGTLSNPNEYFNILAELYHDTCFFIFGCRTGPEIQGWSSSLDPARHDLLGLMDEGFYGRHGNIQTARAARP